MNKTHSVLRASTGSLRLANLEGTNPAIKVSIILIIIKPIAPTIGSLDKEEISAIVTYRVEKSRKTLEQAKSNIALGYWELIANRVYYAAYYAISALLIANGHTAKTHESIIRIFGLYFVKTGKFSAEQGKLYNKLYTLRLTGDYNDHYDLDEQDVLPLIEPAERLILDASKAAIENIEQR